MYPQDLWSILTKDSTVDKQFFWKLNHNQSKLTLLQELGLDDTSTIQWAVFNLERDDLTVESAVELINRYVHCAYFNIIIFYYAWRLVTA